MGTSVKVFCLFRSIKHFCWELLHKKAVMFRKLMCVLPQRPERSRSSAACEVLGVGVVSVPPPPPPGAAEARGRASSRFGVGTASQGGWGGRIYGTVVCSAEGMKERESLNLISETQQLFVCFLKCWQTGGSRAGRDWSSLFFWSEFG